MQRNDVIGAVCAVIAIAIITVLSLDSWAIADCQDLLRAGDFQRAGALEPDAADELAQAYLELHCRHMSLNPTLRVFYNVPRKYLNLLSLSMFMLYLVIMSNMDSVALKYHSVSADSESFK